MSNSMELIVNGERKSVLADLTIADLLRQLQLKSLQVAVEVNCKLVPRESHAEYQLSSGDKIEVMTLVGGG